MDFVVPRVYGHHIRGGVFTPTHQKHRKSQNGCTKTARAGSQPCPRLMRPSQVPCFSVHLQCVTERTWLVNRGGHCGSRGSWAPHSGGVFTPTHQKQGKWHSGAGGTVECWHERPTKTARQDQKHSPRLLASSSPFVLRKISL